MTWLQFTFNIEEEEKICLITSSLSLYLLENVLVVTVAMVGSIICLVKSSQSQNFFLPRVPLKLYSDFGLEFSQLKFHQE